MTVPASLSENIVIQSCGVRAQDTWGERPCAHS